MNRTKRLGAGLALMIVIMAGIYLYSRYNPEDYLLFPKCPVYLLTGYKCPGCGSQRAFYHLFHGDITTAFMYNPLMFLLVPYIFSGLFLEYIASKTNPRVVRLRNLLFGKWMLLVLAVIIILFTILRNNPDWFAGCISIDF